MNGSKRMSLLCVGAMITVSGGCATVKERGATMGVNVGVEDYGRGAHLSFVMQIPGQSAAQGSQLASGNGSHPTAVTSTEKSETATRKEAGTSGEVAKAEHPKREPTDKSGESGKTMDGNGTPIVTLALLPPLSTPGSPRDHSSPPLIVTSVNLPVTVTNAPATTHGTRITTASHKPGVRMH